MAITYTFNRTRDQIIDEALRDLGVLALGGSATSDQVSEAAEKLDIFIKSLSNRSIKVWLYDWITQAFNTASTEITGTDAAIYTCIHSHTSATANRPVTGNEWTVYWRELGSTGGSWSADQSYVSIGDFSFDASFLGIDHAFLRSKKAGGTPVDIPMSIISMREFSMIPDKYSTGLPEALTIDFRNAKIFLWPQPDSSTIGDYVLRYRAIRMPRDFENASATPEFQSRALQMLTWGLADQLSLRYGLQIQERRELHDRFRSAQKDFLAMEDELNYNLRTRPNASMIV